MLALCLVLPMLNAATDTKIVDDTFQVNKIISYAKPCFNNGSYCSSNTKCNYTIFKPDNTMLIDNKQGTNNINRYNISFYVEDIGVYKVDQVCIDNGLWGSETYYFEVTGSGLNDVTYFLVFIFLASFIMIILGFWIKDGWITIFGSLGLFSVGLYILLNGIDIIRNLIITRSFSFIMLGLAAYIGLRSAYETIEL